MKEKHPDWDKVIPLTPEFMAESLGNLKYDELATFLKLLSEKIENDGDKDGARGREKLAKALHSAAANIDQAADDIYHAWDICKPFMK